jgi:cytochrome c556
MQAVGRNFGAVNDLLTKNDFETAKAQLTRAREQLAITIQFWRDNQKDDAIRMLKDTLTKMDALDAALSREKVDTPVVGATAKKVSAACQTCHAGYRDQDPITKAYRLKPGSVH